MMKEDKDLLAQLENILMPDPSLLNMSRLPVAHRRHDEDVTAMLVMLQRKLRLPLLMARKEVQIQLWKIN